MDLNNSKTADSIVQTAGSIVKTADSIVKTADYIVKTAFNTIRYIGKKGSVGFN